MSSYIYILNFLLIINFIYSQDWMMTITADDIENIGAADLIYLGMCETCYDGFNFSEDEYDLGGPPGEHTDITIYNFDWEGTLDQNNNVCNSVAFTVDKKSFHEPADLLVWNIGGFANLNNNNIDIELTWILDELSNDYEIYLYIGNSSYNMRSIDNIIITQEELMVNYNPESGEFIPNIRVLIGGCASEGTTTYYYDFDGDGHGGNQETSQEFCAGFEPPDWVTNNDDVNDNFYCQENIIDLCNVCNGTNDCLDCNNDPWGDAEIDDCAQCSGGNTNYVTNSDMDCSGTCYGTAEIDDCDECSGGNTDHIANSDMDCSGTCYGTAEIDDCGSCDGFNQSCLDEIFLDGPIDINAYINNNIIELHWDQPNYPENDAILGFNIYRNGEYLTSTTEEEYVVNQFIDGEFCISAFDQYANQSELNCSIATDLQEFCWVLDHGLNLMSYPTLPVNSTIGNIFSSIDNYIVGVISEGDAASMLPNGIWVGSLTEIEQHRAYWVKLDLGDIFATQEYCITGYPVPVTLAYELSLGANLISYLGEDNEYIIDALSQYNNNFNSIIGAASAAYNSSSSGWVGSLTRLKRGDGYWVIVNDNFTFYWVNE